MARGKPENWQIVLPSPHFVFYDIEADNVHWDRANLLYAHWPNTASANVDKEGTWRKFEGHKYDLMREFWTWLEWVVCQPETEVGENIHYIGVLAHNGSRYDHLFLWGHLVNDVIWRTWKPSFHVFIGGMLKVLELTREYKGKKHVIRLMDSYSLFQASLANYGMSIGRPKMVRNDDMSNDDIYCRNDVAILELAMYSYQKVLTDVLGLKLGLFGSMQRPHFSGTQLALAIWRGLAEKGKGIPAIGLMKSPLPPRYYDGLEWNIQFNESPHPGTTESPEFWFNTGLSQSTIGGINAHCLRGYLPNVWRYDVSSMYPGIAAGAEGWGDGSLPWSDPVVVKKPTVDDCERWQRQGKGVFVFARFEMPNVSPYLPIPIKQLNKTFRPYGDIAPESLIYWPLVQVALEYGATIEILYAVTFTRVPILKDFMLTMWDLRLDARQRKDEGTAYALKIIMNSLVGSFGTKAHVEGEILLADGFGDKTMHVLESAHIQPQAFIGVTALGQSIMIRELNESKAVYVDTDGFVTLNGTTPKYLKVGDKLGQLKLEHEGVDMLLFQNKVYALRKSRVEASWIHHQDSLFLGLKPRTQYVCWESPWSIAIKALPIDLWSDEVIQEDGRRERHHQIMPFLAYANGMERKGIPAFESWREIVNRCRLKRENAEHQGDHTIEWLREHLYDTVLEQEDSWPQKLDGPNARKKMALMRAVDSRIWPLILPGFDEIAKHACVRPDSPLFEYGDNIACKIVMQEIPVPFCRMCKSNRHVKVNYKTSYRCALCEYYFERCNACSSCHKGNDCDTWIQNKWVMTNYIGHSRTPQYVDKLRFKPRIVEMSWDNFVDSLGE